MLLLFLLTGRLVIWAASWSQLRPVKFLYVKVFEGCDFCLGVWVFSGLDILFKAHTHLLDFYVPIVSEVITGTLTSFVLYVFVTGWRVLYGGSNALDS